MNRQQRRAYESMVRKQGGTPAPKPQTALDLGKIAEELKEMHRQIVSMVEFNKTMYRSMTLLRETLERKGVMSFEDLKETERLYQRGQDRRQKRVKEILASPMSDAEKIEECLSDLQGYRHGYDRLNISPVRDLNVPPQIVNEYLAEKGYVGADFQKWATHLGVPPSMQVIPQREATVHEAAQTPPA